MRHRRRDTQDRHGREAAAPPRSASGSRAWCERISAAQRHRGPDGSGLWQSSGAGGRLRPPAAGHPGPERGAAPSPWSTRDSGCAVTFNGEIYNFAEIRRDLEAQGETFRSSCDTEVILKAYKRWGIEAVRPLPRHLRPRPVGPAGPRGAPRARPAWASSRSTGPTIDDGETGEEVVLFASEVRALLASGAVPRRLDAGGRRVVPVARLRRGPRHDRGGRPAPARGQHPDHRGRRRAGRERAHACANTGACRPRRRGRTTVTRPARRARRTRCGCSSVADVPLGVFLSGGVDSSAVAALASEVVPDAVHTFTIGFDEAAYDETRYAQQVADAIRSRHTTRRADASRLPGTAARRLHGHRPAHLRRHQHLLRQPRGARRRHDRGPRRHRRRRGLRRLPQLRGHPPGPARRRLAAVRGDRRRWPAPVRAAR